MKKGYIPIIKYDPQNRDEKGIYTKDEWTSHSDIGKIYNGSLFSQEDYEKTESQYIQAFFEILSYFHSSNVYVKHIFKISKFIDFKRSKDTFLYDTYMSVQIGDVLSDPIVISKLIQLRLREYIGELELTIPSAIRSEIIFGFDYYMYLYTDKEVSSLLDKIEKIGLFTK